MTVRAYIESKNAGTSQRERASKKQKKNNAGGYSFVLDDFGRLQRFLILGADKPTYYASAKKLAKENVKCVTRCLDEDGLRVVRMVVDISTAGRAPKQDPGIFALACAAAHTDPKVRNAAIEAMPSVCRTGTTMMQFVDAVNELRGWGRGLRRGVAKWYLERSPDSLAYQAVKYQKRGGWSHRDVLRMVGKEASPHGEGHEAVFRWIVGGIDALGERKVDRNGVVKTYPEVSSSLLPKILHGYEAMKKCKSSKEAVGIIREYGLTHEMVLNEFKNDPAVWEALLENMPMGAMVRNLGKMTSVGLTKSMSNASKFVHARLIDEERIKKSRMHPFAFFMAMQVYQTGKGKKGSLTWTPAPKIMEGLDEAVFLSFKNIEPSGVNHLLAVDCSASMDGGSTGGWGFPNISGLDISPRLAAAFMAMVTVRSEESCHTVGFSSGSSRWASRGSLKIPRDALQTVSITRRSTVDGAIDKFRKVPAVGTDCSLPMRWALATKMEVGHFVIYTDNDTWAGEIHPHEALDRYRQKTGIDAKLSVVGMTATEFTIANPDDRGMLDVVGFDSAAPSLLADFAKHGM